MAGTDYAKLRCRLIWAVLAVLLLLIILFCVEAVRDYRLAIGSAEKRSASTASAMMEHADRLFADSDATLQELVAEIERQGSFDQVTGEPFFRLIQQRQKNRAHFSSIQVVDKEGMLRVYSRQFRIKPVNVADRDYFRHHRDHPDSGLFISRPYIGRVSGTLRFSFSRPLHDRQGRFNGLVAITFEASYFNKFYQTIDLGKQGRIILATRQGSILLIEPAFTRPFARDFATSPIFTRMLPAAPAATHEILSPISDTLRIMSYRSLTTVPLVAIVSFEKDEVIAEWRDTFLIRGTVFLGLVFAAIGLMATIFFRQLRRLEVTANQLAAQQGEIDTQAAKILVSAKEWRSTFDAVADVIWILDRGHRIMHANMASEQVFGISPRELIGMHCCEVIYSRVEPRDDCPFNTMVRTGQRTSRQMQRHGRWYEVSVDPIYESGEISRVIFVIKDIDELKKAELREHGRSEMLERIARGTSLADQLAEIVRVVEQNLPGSICSILLVDKDGKRLVTGAAPSLPDVYNRAVNRTRIGEGVGSCGTAAFRRQRVVVEDIATHPFWRGFTPAAEAGLRSCWSEPIIATTGDLMGTFAIYHRVPMAPGSDEIRLIEQSAAFAAIALERDREAAMRLSLEQQLGQAQKMEAIGHLAGGVAHDFNNLLTPIIVYADLLKRGLAGDDKLLPKVEGVVKAAYKARDLTQQLLSFGRKQVLQMQVVDLNEVIDSFMAMLRRTLRENIDIDLRLSAFPAVIRGDRAKIDQIILNLAVNSQDAIGGEGGRITIETGQLLIDSEYARLHPGLEPGRYVLLEFSDTGCGMDEETMSHIFEPFFTTKQPGQGTGLGLANVYGVVRQHGGTLAVQSSVGEGTTFRILLPWVDAEPEADGVLATEPAAAEFCADATILLVEDNDAVRTLVADLLTDLGYKLLVADHPETALELVRSHPEPIDLVISDVVMPGMNGLQLYDRINAERPDIDRVLFMSGYANSISVTAGLLEDEVRFLPKPFNLDALVTRVRRLLAAV